jgi:hypothetical protein
MENKNCCGEQGNYNKKLGTCRTCIISSILLTTIFWTALFIARQHSFPHWIQMIALFFSCLFSLLVLSHAIAFFVKRK